MTFNPDEVSEYLGQFNEAYAAATPPDSSGGSDKIPDGAYQTRIKVAEIIWSKKINDWVLKWELEVLGPEQRGAQLIHWNRFKCKDEQDTRTKLGWLKKDLSVCGIDVQDNLARLEPLLPALEGKILEIQVQTKNGYQNSYFNRLITSANPDEPPPPEDVPF
jgi:hypothetical protein